MCFVYARLVCIPQTTYMMGPIDFSNIQISTINSHLFHNRLQYGFWFFFVIFLNFNCAQRPDFVIFYCESSQNSTNVHENRQGILSE